MDDKPSSRLKIDRSKWGAGPWDAEPDRLEFEAEGFPCLLQRNTMGAWCGYVAVPPTHPAFEMGYAGLEDMGVSAHGGLTYSGPCQGHICHTPKPGTPDYVWWIGFDCAHAGDIIPAFKEFGFANLIGESYRNLEYVRAQVEALAKQLKVLDHGR